MSDSDPLLAPLQSLSRQSLSPLCKLSIMKGFWTTLSSTVDWKKIPLDTYFEYFEHQCRLALHDWSGDDISTLNFSHVVDIAKMIREGSTRAEMEGRMEIALAGNCAQLSPEIVDLTVRLLLMIQIGGFRNVHMPSQETLAWLRGPLSDSLHGNFSRDNALKDSVDLDTTFMARNIERIAGIRIVWTSNLLDHLRMLDNDSSVALFHHASFLNFQKNWYVYL